MNDPFRVNLLPSDYSDERKVIIDLLQLYSNIKLYHILQNYLTNYNGGIMIPLSFIPMGRKYADSERIVHSLFANSGRKSRRKERKFTLKSKGANLMSKVVYRGVAYDTEVRRQQQQQQQHPQQYNETYRGVKFVKEEK